MPSPSRESKFSSANGNTTQLTASRIDNLTRLIHTLAKCDGHTLPWKRIRHVKNREFESGREHSLSREPVSSEGKRPEVHGRCRGKARDRKVFILFVDV